MSVLIVSCHYDEDVSWLKNQTDYDYIIYSKTDPEIGTLIDKNIGAKAEAYLHYIIDHYDRLPEKLGTRINIKKGIERLSTANSPIAANASESCSRYFGFIL